MAADKNSLLWNDRLQYYKLNKDDLDMKNDESSEVRLFYYKTHKDDPDMKNDPHKSIRRLYFILNPDDSSALDDECYDIWKLYMTRHPEILESYKYSKNVFARAIYYRDHLFDEDWKNDESSLLKTLMTEITGGNQ